MEILDFLKKKQSKYLLTLLMLNNINAGSGKRCGKKGDNDTKNKQSSTQSSEQNGDQENHKEEDPKDENPDPEEEKKKKEEEEKKKQEEEKKKKEQAEIDRLNEKAAPIKKFFNILKKAYECKLTKAKKTIIKCDIDDAKLIDFVKYLEDLDFTNYTDNDFALLGKLLQIFKIDGGSEDFDALVTKLNNSKHSLLAVIEDSAYLKYAQDLFNYTSDWNLLIVKDKYTGNFCFTIKQQANKINYKNERYDIIDLYIHEAGYIGLLKQSNDDMNKIDDIRMNLALNLSSNLLRDFHMCLTSDAVQILNHVVANANPLPKVDAQLKFYSEAQEKDIQGTYSYVWTNGYLYDFSKKNVDSKDLYECQNILKIKVDANYKIQYSFEKGKKDPKGNFTYTPFGFETTKELGKILTGLNDPSKVEDVKNEAIELLKKDKEFKGLKISIMGYLPPSSSMNFHDFDTMENSDFPYKYNVYIYKDNGDIKIDIKKWEDNEENNKIIKLINSFKNDLKTLFGEQNYKFSAILNLIKTIKDKFNKDDVVLNNIIKFFFSSILTNEEWNKLDTDNLCIKIANDLSSIKLDKNPKKEADFKVLKLIKGGTSYYFYTDEVK